MQLEKLRLEMVPHKISGIRIFKELNWIQERKPSEKNAKKPKCSFLSVLNAVPERELSIEMLSKLSWYPDNVFPFRK